MWDINPSRWAIKPGIHAEYTCSGIKWSLVLLTTLVSLNINYIMTVYLIDTTLLAVEDSPYHLEVFSLELSMQYNFSSLNSWFYIDKYNTNLSCTFSLNYWNYSYIVLIDELFYILFGSIGNSIVLLIFHTMGMYDKSILESVKLISVHCNIFKLNYLLSTFILFRSNL